MTENKKKIRCSTCGMFKLISEFRKVKDYRERGLNYGVDYCCRDCTIKKQVAFRKTKDGLSDSIMCGQRQSSKKRNHPKPDYTLQEFRDWLYSQSNFIYLYNNWVESDYEKYLKPSADRIDDNKPYTLDNLQLMTWGENDAKASNDHKTGKIIYDQKAVVGVNKITGEVVSFFSMNEAQRQLKINNISYCCNGKRNSAGGYHWKFL